MAKFNGKNVTIKESGSSYSSNFNGQNEGGGSRSKYSAYNQSGERIGAVVHTSNTRANIYQNGKIIGNVRVDDE